MAGIGKRFITPRFTLKSAIMESIVRTTFIMPVCILVSTLSPTISTMPIGPAISLGEILRVKSLTKPTTTDLT